MTMNASKTTRPGTTHSEAILKSMKLAPLSVFCKAVSSAGALALADQLAKMAPNTLASGKQLMQDALLAPLREQLDRERDHFVRNLHHANAGEGIDAFINKRPAKYR